jgi:hypothetical protein
MHPSKQSKDAINGIHHFPSLRQANTFFLTEVAVVFIICAVLSPILGRFWKPFGWVLWLPGVLLAAYLVIVALRNCGERLSWAQKFDQRVSSGKAIKMLAQQPSRYVVHCRHYGGMDRTRLKPAAVVEDTQTAVLTAVFPASWRIINAAKQLGVRIESY